MPRKKTEVDVLEDEFDVDTSDLNRRYVYELAIKNDRRGRVFDANTSMPINEEEYKPRVNCLLRSAIVLTKEQAAELSKQEGVDIKAGKTLIEYYDGCTTIFSDFHPKEKDVLETFRKQTRDVIFQKGLLEIYGYDTLLKQYLDFASWNGESPYRIKRVEALYIPVDSESVAERDSEDIDDLEKALELARTASVKKMRIHGRFLGVSEIDIKTHNPVSEKAMRAEYRKAAKRNPREFIKTYNDKSLELKSWISKALELGEINTSIIPNQAVWKSKGQPICDISGLTARENILNKLIAFAQTDEGSDFNEQLRSLYN